MHHHQLSFGRALVLHHHPLPHAHCWAGRLCGPRAGLLLVALWEICHSANVQPMGLGLGSDPEPHHMGQWLPTPVACGPKTNRGSNACVSPHTGMPVSIWQPSMVLSLADPSGATIQKHSPNMYPFGPAAVACKDTWHSRFGRQSLELLR